MDKDKINRFNRLSLYSQLLKNMGLKYVLFRTYHEIKCKSGINKRNYPISYLLTQYISLKEWKKESPPFFFSNKEKIIFPFENKKIENKFTRLYHGEDCYFFSQWYKVELNKDWITNVNTGYKYDINQHWTEIKDIDKKAGDIKYIWEKSRFSFLYTVIRYDQYQKENHSSFVFDQIIDWINKNPINCGPNYKCSQEISLRVLNWIFALYYYQNSPFLTEEIFQKITNSIYWQIKHVYSNINFSRIAVRNNHAITETLSIFLTGILFPTFPDSKKWIINGKKWFEQEICYQIEEDGTYLQYSMNYHRVVIQLLTWAITLCDNNGIRLKQQVYERAYQSVNFLFQCQELSNGYLPNYGSNDGALFFQLNDNDYRDFRPQLDTLHYILTGKNLYDESYEDRCWYTPNWTHNREFFPRITRKYGFLSFPQGGYYLIREKETLTFIRCGGYAHRPAHADNLHIDIWHKNKNILMDSGSYKYNTDEELLNYFMGTTSHNTIMLDSNNQMLKGPRFIWYYWSKFSDVKIEETENEFIFYGEINCFRYLNKKIKHARKIIKLKNSPQWYIQDTLINKPKNLNMIQIWHTSSKNIDFQTNAPICKKVKGMYSEHYGEIKENKMIQFKTKENSIETNIEII